MTSHQPIRVAWFFLVLVCACRPKDATPLQPDPLRLSTAELHFPDTYIGATHRLTLSLANPTRLVRSVFGSAVSPFHVTERLAIPAGESLEIEVTFEPYAAGPHAVRLTFLDEALNQELAVSLTGTGLQVPVCASPTACRSPVFDLVAGTCRDNPSPDEAPCASPLSCFARAECVKGECVGSQVTCDDGNPCTLDVCTDTGCGQVDRVPFCPTSSNPCLIPVCSRDAGCGLAEVVDGTSCGERTCTTALVCISGQCVARTPPRNQSCAEVLVGVPAGRGFVDGRNSEVRVSAVRSIAVQGDDVLFMDDRRLRHLRGGVVRTIAGNRGSFEGIVDGAGTAVSFSSVASLAASSQPGLFFVGEETTIRLATLQGVVSTLAGSSDGGRSKDGVGSAARLNINLWGGLTVGGSGARFLEYPFHPESGDSITVREIGLTGAVRTLGVVKLAQFIPDGGWGELWATVTDEDPLTIQLRIRNLLVTPPLPQQHFTATWRDGGSPEVVASRGFHTRWRRGALEIEQTTSCELYFRADGGFRRVEDCGVVAFDGRFGAWVASDGHLEHFSSSGSDEFIGPHPDRRYVDGSRDGGRLVWPSSLALGPEGVFLDDNGYLRLFRLSQSSSDGALESLVRGQTTSLTYHRGDLWYVNENGFVLQIDPRTGSRLGQWQLNGFRGQPILKSNGQFLRLVNFGPLYEFQFDAGVQLVTHALTYCDRLAAGPNHTWYVHGRGPGDGGFVPLQLFRIEPDSSVVPLAGAPRNDHADGLAFQAGVSEVSGLTVASDGTVYFLTGNRLRRLKNGEVSTILEFADLPFDLVALPDGSLVVSVDAALLRVFP